MGFVTLTELQELGLDHLVGSPLLRAHMHGFFMDIRLYRKASSAKPANALENMKKDLIRKQIEAQREGRVKIETKVPKVNKDLFVKLKIDEDHKKSSKKKTGGDLLEDNRFGALFTDDRFEVDKDDENFRLLNPVVSKLDKDKKKEFERKYGVKDSDDEMNSGDSDIEVDDESGGEESSDDDQEWTKEVKREHKKIKNEKLTEKMIKKAKKKEQKWNEHSKERNYTFSEIKDGEEFSNISEKKVKQKKSKISLEDRIQDDENIGEIVKTETGHVMTFAPEKSRYTIKKEQEEKKHREERRKIRRSAKTLKKDKLP